MFEETAPKRTGAFRSVLLIVVSGFVLLSLPDWVESLPTPFDLPYATAIYELMVFLAVGLMIYRFMRAYAVEYQYSLADAVLTVRSKSGARITVVAEIPLTGTSELMPLEDGEELIRNNRWKKREISFGVTNKKEAFLLTFPPKNGISALIFQPSEKFVEILKQKLLDKRNEM